MSWIIANEEDTEQYLDPKNPPKGSNEYFQFLVLSQPACTRASDVNNRILTSNKGVLSGKANSFIKAAKVHNINELYLISHTLLETGNGSSNLPTGISVDKNKKCETTIVTDSNSKSLTDQKTVYNMFGIGAVDMNPNNKGTIKAYDEGWTSPKKAIVGGAKFIAEKYINADKDTFQGQNTLYKMR